MIAISDWIKSLVIAVIIALFIRAFFVEAAVVSGESMYPTLINGERLIVNKMSNSSFERGNIIVFKGLGKKIYVKRIVGIGGDSVKIKDSVLYINGLAVEEEYVANKKMDDFGPESVPKECFFILGDNRPISFDSRSGDMGFICKDMIRGKVAFVFWPILDARIVK